MNRYQYKGYWIEFFIEGDELTDYKGSFYLMACVELPDQKGVVTLGDRYVTLQAARQGVEKFIDRFKA